MRGARQAGAVAQLEVSEVERTRLGPGADRGGSLRDRRRRVESRFAEGQQQVPGHQVAAVFVREPYDLAQTQGIEIKQQLRIRGRRPDAQLAVDLAAELAP